MNFDNGVASYVVGTATVEVPFPVDYKGNRDVRCLMCRYYSSSGRSCRLNGEIVYYPEKYIGAFCPLNFDTEEK